ncbi:hypothetical protein Pyrde_1840 [Pyrodictium delaneyi]|uniref:Uncharacterized protein n=1 Tax=Pyrodictium delaneyi TaxID=1273541 RepID=A0A0P0N4Q8_9CREN|nr:hypothetical protein [Pyrodictium delaneyi]ALL01883.1 hypothetical protein Pyrde_1840 [Pyrodictium delaneyi]
MRAPMRCPAAAWWCGASELPGVSGTPNSWLSLLAVEGIRLLLDKVGRERLKRLVEDLDSDPRRQVYSRNIIW